MSSKGVKRKALSIEEKIKILKDVDISSHLSRVQIAKNLNLPVTTLNGIIAKRDIILNSSVSGQSLKTKKVKKGKYEDVEEKLMIWFKQSRSANIPISGTILKEKAEEIAKKMNVEFIASNGWIDRMKKRTGLVYKSVTGECKSVDLQEVEKWKSMLPELISGYQPKDIFNMDECGIFYNLLPDKTYTFKGENCHGGKLSKERLTILLGANMDGTEKLPILVLGKSKNPRCFHNVKSLPCEYDSNKKSWMTITIFEAYLKRLDSKMRKAKRNIIIFVDNCAAHSKDAKYSNIKLRFLPPNSTSLLQPMDRGVIKVFKQHYKKRLVKRLLRGLESTGELKKVNVLEAINFIVSAWESVTPSVIANCFQSAGFSDGESTEVYELDAEDEFSDKESKEEFVDDWMKLQKNMNFTTSFEEYVSVDDDVLPCDMLSVDDICEITDDNEEMNEPDEEDVKVPSLSDAEKGLETFRRFIYSIEDVPQEVFKNLRQLENFNSEIAVKMRKQKIIQDFFYKSNTYES